MIYLYTLLGLILGLSIFCFYLLNKVTKLRAQVWFLYKSVRQLEDAVVKDWKQKVKQGSVKPPPPPITRKNPFASPPIGAKDLRPMQKPKSSKSDNIVSLTSWRSKRGK